MKVVRTVPWGGKPLLVYLSRLRIGEPVLGKYYIVYMTISIYIHIYLLDSIIGITVDCKSTYLGSIPNLSYIPPPYFSLPSPFPSPYGGHIYSFPVWRAYYPKLRL